MSPCGKYPHDGCGCNLDDGLLKPKMDLGEAIRLIEQNHDDGHPLGMCGGEDGCEGIERQRRFAAHIAKQFAAKYPLCPKCERHHPNDGDSCY